MVCGLSNSVNNLVSHPTSFDEEIEPIERHKASETSVFSDENPPPIQNSIYEEIEYEPSFDWAVKCLAEQTSFISSDLLELSKISSYVNKNFGSYLSIAEEIHSLLSEDHIPVLEPQQPVPYYAVAKVREALYKPLGPLLRYLNAVRNYNKYHDLILVGLYGHIPEGRDIKISADNPDAGALKGSVKEHLDIPFAELSSKRKAERLAYYDTFYSLLKRKMDQIESIQEEYMVYDPCSKIEIDWIQREIEVSEAALESIMYIAKTKFGDLIALAIDTEMEVRLIDLILQCVIMSKAEFFHIPDTPDVFRVKTPLVEERTEVQFEETCAEVLLTYTSIHEHVSFFVENLLLRPSSVSFIFNDCEYALGGAENDFPMNELKACFLNQLNQVESVKAHVQKIRENPVIGKMLGKREKLKTADFVELFKEECGKYNDAKTRLKGSFIISRINQICDLVEFSKKELKGISKELHPLIEFLFPLYLLQIILMTNDNAPDVFIEKYDSKKCFNGRSANTYHIIKGLDEHRFIFKTHFMEGSVTGYSIAGTLAISSFWTLGNSTVVPFKSIRFSPFISFETLAVLCDNILLKFDRDAFKNDRLSYYNKLVSLFDDLLVNGSLLGLKVKLEDVIRTREVLCGLLKDRKELAATDEILRTFELQIRRRHYFERDALLSSFYNRIYGEHGFLRKGY